MALMVIQHPVRDDDGLGRVDEEVASLQQAAAVSNESVHRSMDDPNIDLVPHSFGSIDQATPLLEYLHLQEAMREEEREREGTREGARRERERGPEPERERERERERR